MSDIKISLNTTGSENEITLVRVDGVIDTMTATELEKVINSLLEQKRFYIIIDLAGVDYISSAGWGIFISNIREIRQQGGDIKLARMIPNVYEIFELLEFDSILKAFGSIDEAREDFKYISEKVGSPLLKQPEPVTAESPGRERMESPVVIDSITPGPEPVVFGKKPALAEKPLPKMSFDQKVRQIIKNDPFLSINGIKQELRTDNYQEKSVGWWGVFKWLYSRKLTTRKSRYRLSRGSK